MPTQLQSDWFTLAGMEQRGLTPVRSASPQVLARRLYLDLIGLPPTPEQSDAFKRAARDDRQSAIRELADTLLRSPQDGERWGRHWHDVARYSED